MAAAIDARTHRTSLPPEVIVLARGLGVNMEASATRVRLAQSGRMRQDPTSPWMKFKAKQTIAIDHCEFAWRASTGPGGFVHVHDKLADGQGGLNVSVMDVLPMARLKRSPELTRAELIRYLAELALAPDAIVFNANLQWSILSARLFRLAAGEGEARVSVELKIDDNGRIAEAYTEARPRAVLNSFTPTPWRGRFTDYRKHQGRWLPFAGEVAWVPDGQEFVCWQGRIETWAMSATA